jgi:hypothetical protein
MTNNSSNTAWETKYQSSVGMCFFWAVIFTALAVWIFAHDMRQQEERSLKSPVSIKGNFESAYCGSKTGIKASGHALFIKYSYEVSVNGNAPQRYTATDYRGMADLRTCESALLSASKSYPSQYFYYEADDPQKYRLSIEKQSSFYMLVFGLLLAAIPAALGFSELENKRNRKRKG